MRLVKLFLTRLNTRNAFCSAYLVHLPVAKPIANNLPETGSFKQSLLILATMTKFYPLFKTLFTVIAIAGMFQVSAQSPTIVTNSNACEVVQNFNTTNGAFTTPSIFTIDDYSLYYSGAGP